VGLGGHTVSFFTAKTHPFSHEKEILKKLHCAGCAGEQDTAARAPGGAAATFVARLRPGIDSGSNVVMPFSVLLFCSKAIICFQEAIRGCGEDLSKKDFFFAMKETAAAPV